MEKKSFVLGSAWAQRMLEVPDEDFAIIVKAVFQFALTGEHDNVPGLHKALVSEMTAFLADNAEKYEEVCRKRREAGSLGGKQKVANAKQKVANATKCLANGSKSIHDNDNDNVNDNDNDNDNVILTDNRKKVDANASKKETIAALVERWNSYGNRGNIPTIRSVSVDSACGKSVIARVTGAGLDEVHHVMDEVFQSDYLRGMVNSWNATFDWVFKPTNFDKIRNGNYTNKGGGNLSRAQAEFLADWVNEREAL